MLATNTGDLLGSDWIESLKRFGARISGLAARLQSLGIKPNRSKRYRARVAELRGFIDTEVGRVLNHLVQTRPPAHLVLERLDFRGMGLSRRLNGLLTNCGRAVLRAKLKDLEDRFGITLEEVIPAYSSQTCSNPDCGYIDGRNRKSQSRFICGCCGMALQADVNGSRNPDGRRSVFERRARVTKETALQLTVMRHLERMGAARERVVLDLALWPSRIRDRVIPGSGVHVSSPYFRDILQGLWAETDSDTTGGPRKPRKPHRPAVRRARQIHPDLVADVSVG